MRLGKIIGYSYSLMSGSKMRFTLLCSAIVGTQLLFRLSEASVYWIMLYFGNLRPAELFMLNNPIKVISGICFTLMRYFATAPLIYCAAYRTTGICMDNGRMRCASLSGLILNKKRFGRSLCALLISKAVGFVFLIPTVFFGITAFRLISESSDSSVRLFMAVHAAVMTLLSAGLWVRAKLAMMCVPFLLIREPEKSVFSISAESFRFIRGRRSTLLKIILFYAPQGLLIFTAPIALSGLLSATALCIDIFIKEDAYRAKTENDRDIGQACNSPIIPDWPARDLKTASEPTEAH